MHLASIWEAISDVIGDEIAFVHGDRQIAWQQFDDRSARLASALAGLGLRPGAVVAIDMYNCPEFFEVFFAALKAGFVPTMVNYRYRAGELVHLLDHSGAEIVVAHPDLGDDVRAVADRLPRLREVVDLQSDYEALIAGHDPAPRRSRGEDGFLLSYTGGTTGVPKGVVYGMHKLAAQALGTRALVCAVDADYEQAPAGLALELTSRAERVVVCPASPLMHSTGFTFVSLPALTAGGTVVTLENRRFVAAPLLEEVERHHVTALGIVGDAFGRPLVAALDERAATGCPFDLTDLRVICSAGVAFSADTKRRLFGHVPDLTIVDACGSTEGATYGMSIVRAGDDPSTARFRPAEGTVVVDPSGVELPAGEVGFISAITVSRGYHNDPEATAQAFHVDGDVQRVVPGDYGRMESDGTLTLLGRGSTVINTGGEKVHPEEVEDAIKSVRGVVDVVVSSVPDERLGQVVGAVVQPDAGRSPTETEIIDHVRGLLAGYKAPRRVVFVDTIPRSPNGKVATDAVRRALGCP